jgi:hypothetical protein
MKDVYFQKFSVVLDEVSHGTLPPPIHSYMASLLAEHVEKTDFFSEPVALRYMSIKGSMTAKELGDNCLVIAGIFPGFRGMSDDYYVSIGAGSYGVAATYTGSAIFKSLACDFDEYRAVLNRIRPPSIL